MANFITITSHPEFLEVKFNKYSPSLGGLDDGFWHKSKLTLKNYKTYFEVNITGEKTWWISFNGVKTPYGKHTLIIENINGNPIDSHETLKTQLKNMLI